MRLRFLIPLAIAVMLAPASADPASTPAEPDAGALPRALVEAVARKDPLALADTTLPRLAELTASQRHDLARSIATWPVNHRVAAWAFLQVGIPYELGPLGEGAPPDTQPVIAFGTADCATLNLVAAAMAHREDAGGERRAMALANYRGGRIGYATRLHFTTDRLDVSPYYRDITKAVAGTSARVARVRLNRRAAGGHWIPIPWTRARQVFWVPRERGARFARWHDERRIPDAMGVAFVRRATFGDGLDVMHESLLWKGRTLLHASSTTGQVITIPWTEYLEGPGRRWDGFVLFAYR